MIGAVIDNFGVVVNKIVLRENQVQEIQMALNAEIVDASEYGLTIGDRRDGGVWTRNVNGETVTLTPLVQEEIDRAAVLIEGLNGQDTDELLDLIEGIG